MVLGNGSIADASEVAPQIYAGLRQLITEDKELSYHKHKFANNYFVDGFSTVNLVASSTNWNLVGKSYWTSTNAADLIGATYTFPSTLSYSTPYVDYITCETIDEFNDSSVNTSIWDTSVNNSGTITEDTAEILIKSYNTNYQTSTSYIQSKAAVLDSTHKYLAIKFRWDYAASSTGGSSGDQYGQVSIILTDGSNTATPFSIWDGYYNNPSGTSGPRRYEYSQLRFNDYGYTPRFDSSGKFSQMDNDVVHLVEMFYNPDSKEVLVYYDGYFYDLIAATALSSLKIKLIAQSGSNYTIQGASNVCNLYVDWVRREKASPASTLTTNISADNGSHYTATTRETETAIGTTGTQFKIKNTATISGSEYIHVRGYSAFVR